MGAVCHDNARELARRTGGVSVSTRCLHTSGKLGVQGEQVGCLSAQGVFTHQENLVYQENRWGVCQHKVSSHIRKTWCTRRTGGVSVSTRCLHTSGKLGVPGEQPWRIRHTRRTATGCKRTAGELPQKQPREQLLAVNVLQENFHKNNQENSYWL